MHIINGKLIADKKLEELKETISKSDRTPSLAVILVGNDEPSHLYVKIKEKACKKVGIDFHKYLLNEDSTAQEILDVITFLNNDSDIDGIVVQLPLPDRKMEDKIINHIDPKKDADGFHPENIKRLIEDQHCVTPGLASGILNLIKSTNQKLAGAKCLIICNTKIFATPIRALLNRHGIIVNVIEPSDPNIFSKTKTADILIIAIGQPEFLSANQTKNNAIIIDVGINYRTNKKIVGDVNFSSFSNTQVWVTPVPGGVGPMTVAMLLENVYLLKVNGNK